MKFSPALLGKKTRALPILIYCIVSCLITADWTDWDYVFRNQPVCIAALWTVENPFTASLRLLCYRSAAGLDGTRPQATRALNMVATSRPEPSISAGVAAHLSPDNRTLFIVLAATIGIVIIVLTMSAVVCFKKQQANGRHCWHFGKQLRHSVISTWILHVRCSKRLRPLLWTVMWWITVIRWH